MRELSFRQWHHGYLGILLILVSFWFGGNLMRILGGIFILDDGLEHFIQWRTQTEWQSPLRRLYGIFYRRWAWLRAVNAWLDQRFMVSKGTDHD